MNRVTRAVVAHFTPPKRSLQQMQLRSAAYCGVLAFVCLTIGSGFGAGDVSRPAQLWGVLALVGMASALHRWNRDR